VQLSGLYSFFRQKRLFCGISSARNPSFFRQKRLFLISIPSGVIKRAFCPLLVTNPLQMQCNGNAMAIQ